MDSLIAWVKKNPLIVVVAVVAFFFLNQNKTKKTVDPEPTPAAMGQAFSEEESWETLARWVESQPMEDTDHLLKMARIMRDTGVVSRESMKRLDSLLVNKAITEDNKAEIAKLVRGK
jgi:hypothetical protein